MTTKHTASKPRKKAKVEKHEVVATSDGFDPSRIEIAVGETVRFVNEDDKPHTASFDNGAKFHLSPDGHHDHKFTTPGSWSFHCDNDPGMTGVVVVS